MATFEERVRARFESGAEQRRQRDIATAQQQRQEQRRRNIVGAQAESQRYAQEAQDLEPGFWGNLAGSVAESIVKPIAGVLEAPAIVGRGIYKGATGQGFDFKPVFDMEKRLGVKSYYQKAQELGGDFVEGKKGMQAVAGTLAEPIVDVVTALYTPAKGLQALRGGKYLHAAAVGGLSAAPYGTVEALQQEQGMWEAAKKTALYGGAGAMFGLGLAGGGALVAKAVRKLRGAEDVQKAIKEAKPTEQPTGDAVEFLATRPDVNIGITQMAETPAGKAAMQVEKNYDAGTTTIMLDREAGEEVVEQAAGYYLAGKTDITDDIAKEADMLALEAQSIQDQLAIGYKKLISGEVKPEEAPLLTKTAKDNGLEIGVQKKESKVVKLPQLKEELGKFKSHKDFFDATIKSKETNDNLNRIFDAENVKLQTALKEIEPINKRLDELKKIAVDARGKGLTLEQAKNDANFVKMHEEYLSLGAKQKELQGIIQKEQNSFYKKTKDMSDEELSNYTKQIFDNSKKETSQPVETTQSKMKVSESRKRLAEGLGVDVPVEYKTMNIAREVEDAAKLIEKDPIEAQRVAMGMSGDDPLGQATAGLLFEKAKQQGDDAAVAQYFNKIATKNTEAGQTLNIMKALNAKNPETRFMADVVRARFKGNMIFKEFGDLKKVAENVTAIAKKAIKEVNTRTAKVINAQKLLDSIKCTKITR
jgi:hypothetical protein